MLLGPTAKRAIFSAILALPISLLAFVVSDKALIPDALRVLISPGWAVALRLAHLFPGESCGGLFDCLVQIGYAAGREAEIILFVNTIIYGLLIFGIVTTVSALRGSQAVKSPL